MTGVNEVVDFARWLERVRRGRPLVHNITNAVVASRVADALAALGASPVMAVAAQEAADVARGADALALNLGTPDQRAVNAMLGAGRAANAASVPVVLDPVGVGATAYRDALAARLASQLRLTVLRGNQGEIGSMLGTGGQVRGVDSVAGGVGLIPAMQAWARAHACVVIATGPIDYVADGTRVLALGNGDPLLGVVPGAGCQLTALIGAWIAVAGRDAGLDQIAEACVAAVSSFNVAGELAAAAARGPGSFQVELVDALHRLDGTTVAARARVEPKA